MRIRMIGSKAVRVSASASVRGMTTNIDETLNPHPERNHLGGDKKHNPFCKHDETNKLMHFSQRSALIPLDTAKNSTSSTITAHQSI